MLLKSLHSCFFLMGGVPSPRPIPLPLEFRPRGQSTCIILTTNMTSIFRAHVLEMAFENKYTGFRHAISVVYCLKIPDRASGMNLGTLSMFVLFYLGRLTITLNLWSLKDCLKSERMVLFFLQWRYSIYHGFCLNFLLGQCTFLISYIVGIAGKTRSDGKEGQECNLYIWN